MIFRKQIRVVITLPRWAPSDTQHCLLHTCAALNVNVNRGMGIFWHQSMSKLMTAAATQAKYVLTVDGDSYWTPADVISLYNIMEQRKDIDALAGFQMQRGVMRAIAGYRDEDMIDGLISPSILFADTFQARYAHFGLTLFRSSKLNEFPKPWFVDDPGQDGEWGDDRTDSDIDFWNKWNEHGNTIHIANKVVIGHGEYVISWPSQSLEKVYQQPVDFFDNGIPKETWPLKITEVINDVND